MTREIARLGIWVRMGASPIFTIDGTDAMTEAVVLIVESDGSLRARHSAILSDAGYRTIESTDGESALRKFETNSPDMILLDVHLGNNGMDGLELCRRIRRVSQVPIIFLTSKTDEVDELIGLTVGADDYLAKPISSRLLAAKVAAVFRRTQEGFHTSQPATINTPELEIDPSARTVTVNEIMVNLTRTQFDLLAALAENPTRVLTREQLVSRVWGEWYGADHHLDVHLSRLRKKIEDVGGPRVAHAVRGVGFRLRA